MHCRFCSSKLQPVHGHGACLRSGCPMFGLNQDACCNGETCEMPVGDPEGREEAVTRVEGRDLDVGGLGGR